MYVLCMYVSIAFAIWHSPPAYANMERVDDSVQACGLAVSMFRQASLILIKAVQTCYEPSYPLQHGHWSFLWRALVAVFQIRGRLAS